MSTGLMATRRAIEIWGSRQYQKLFEVGVRDKSSSNCGSCWHHDNCQNDCLKGNKDTDQAGEEARWESANLLQAQKHSSQSHGLVGLVSDM